MKLHYADELFKINFGSTDSPILVEYKLLFDSMVLSPGKGWHVELPSTPPWSVAAQHCDPRRNVAMKKWKPTMFGSQFKVEIGNVSYFQQKRDAMKWHCLLVFMSEPAASWRETVIAAKFEEELQQRKDAGLVSKECNKLLYTFWPDDSTSGFYVMKVGDEVTHSFQD